MTIKKLVPIFVASAALLLTLSVSNAVATDSEAPSALAGIAEKAANVKEMINLNSASTDMLAAIPGIGPKIAEAITSYRDANGAFSQIKDLVNVEGIDMSLIEKITPLLSL